MSSRSPTGSEGQSREWGAGLLAPGVRLRDWRGATACRGRKGHLFESGPVVVEVAVGGWGRAGLALLAQPQTCDSSASGSHHREQWREQGAWLLGAPALSVQESKGTRGLQASPPSPHPATAVCLGTGTHSSRGAQPSGKVSP